MLFSPSVVDIVSKPIRIKERGRAQSRYRRLTLTMLLSCTLKGVSKGGGSVGVMILVNKDGESSFSGKFLIEISSVV